MQQIPEDEVPHVNSRGEQHRLHQLLHQMPPQDNDLRYCRSAIAEDERTEIRLFIAKRKKDSIGQGTVTSLGISAAGTVCRNVKDAA